MLPLPEASLEPSAAALANAALERLRLLTKTRRLDLRASFAPFDRHNTGKLPPSVFERAFPVTFRESEKSRRHLWMGNKEYNSWQNSPLTKQRLIVA